VCGVFLNGGFCKKLKSKKLKYVNINVYVISVVSYPIFYKDITTDINKH